MIYDMVLLRISTVVNLQTYFPHTHMCWFYFEGLTTFDEPWHVDRPTRWTLLRLVNYLTQVPETISPFLFAKSSWFQPYRVACGDKFSFKWLWSLFFPTDRFSYRLLGPLSSLWILWIGWIWTFPLKLAAAALSSCRVSLHDRCVGVLPPVSRSCLPWFLLWARPGKGSMGIFFLRLLSSQDLQIQYCILFSLVAWVQVKYMVFIPGHIMFPSVWKRLQMLWCIPRSWINFKFLNQQKLVEFQSGCYLEHPERGHINRLFH